MKTQEIMHGLFIGAALLTGLFPLVAKGEATGDYYVSASGSDSNDGASRATPFATIAKAVEVATDNQTICVLPGEYGVDAAIVIDKAVTVIGDTSNPENVIVRNTKTAQQEDWLRSWSTNRVFVLNHADAVLSGVVAENGVTGGTGDFKGANILIDKNGGTVKNCVIRNGLMYGIYVTGAGKNGTSGGGIACLSADGLISHCVITNNKVIVGNADVNINPWDFGGAAGVHLQNGGRIVQSLIAYNTVKDCNFGSAVLLGNTTSIVMENCTVARNSASGEGNFYPVMVMSQNASQTPTVRNTLIVANKGVNDSSKLFDDVWDASAVGDMDHLKMYNCATDATLPTGFPESLNMITTGLAISPDFRAAASSSSVNAGGTMTIPVDVDLAGNERVYDDVVDIGCYEYVGGDIAVPVSNPVFSPETGTVFSEPLEVTLTSETEGASIYYTTDGSEPSQRNGSVYHGPITLGVYSGTTTIKAIAVKDGMDASDIVSATYTFKVSYPVYYVSTTGSDETGDGSADYPFATIAYAVEKAEDGKTIRLREGRYEIDTVIVLNKAISLVGDTDDPAKVVIANVGELENAMAATHRVLKLNNKDAVVSGLTVEDGFLSAYADDKGGNIWIDTAGGMVTNCIIRNGRIKQGPTEKTGAGGAGIWCNSASGVISHCVITNNYGTRNAYGNTTDGETRTGVGNWGSGAAAVFLQDGKLLHSLIAYNKTEKDEAASIVYLNGGTVMENCTVAGNEALGTIGELYPILFQGNASPTIRNTLIYGNTGVNGNKDLFAEPWRTQYAANLAAASRFITCASDATLPDGWTMISSGFSFQARTFIPKSECSIKDAGSTMAFPVDVDLAGGVRLYGKAVDIGCYECQVPAGMCLSIR